MRTRYWADKKSGPVVTRANTPIQGGRNVVFGADHAVRAKRPVTKKTAAELLAADDNKRKAGCREESLLTAVQRETLINRAGENYMDRLVAPRPKSDKPPDPFVKRKNESVAEYVARINRAIKAAGKDSE